MTNLTATAVAHPNIAFIKYWGNRSEELRLAANSNLSMNLDGLHTQTTVAFDPHLFGDEFMLNEQRETGQGLARVTHFLDLIRSFSGLSYPARVTSQNNFPTGAGIASSAAAFAALALAASTAAGLNLSQAELSRLARRGSGSACRSVPGGFVEWQAGQTDLDSYAVSIAPASHWDLVDCIAVLSSGHKTVGSTEGHAAAATSPLQSARLADAPRRLEIAHRAVLERDFPTLAEIVEHDSNIMHAVMMTSQPPLFYWEPASLEIMRAVPTWRSEGLLCCYTLDAGPNVHVICPAAVALEVQARLTALLGPRAGLILTAHPGGPARLIAKT
jgi:diphosphomevalonate decarboxylase